MDLRQDTALSRSTPSATATYSASRAVTPTKPQTYVIKRSGKRAPLDVTRIRNVVQWACQDLEANTIELEAGLKTRLKDGVTTREIQENLIQCALEMCSPEEPDWRYVAGRLHIWSLWKDTLVARGYQYGQYPQLVADKVAAKAYDERLLQYSGGARNCQWLDQSRLGYGL